jgi:hypothetical protein
MLRSLLLLTVGAAVASAGTLRTDPAPPEAAAAVAVAAAAEGAPAAAEEVHFAETSAAKEESAAPSGPVDWPPQGVGAKPAKPGQFVPFGKSIPRKSGVTYYTATGVQECMVCKLIIENAYKVGPQFYEMANRAYPEMVDMVHAQQKTLQACPEFANDWCYQDLGGSQQLRAPCPDHLKCHYCLGLNPLHCLDI